MPNKWKLPKWVEKYLDCFSMSASIYFDDGYVKKITKEYLEQIIDEDENSDNYTVPLFIQADRIKIQIELLKKLKEKGLLNERMVKKKRV